MFKFLEWVFVKWFGLFPNCFGLTSGHWELPWPRYKYLIFDDYLSNDRLRDLDIKTIFIDITYRCYGINEMQFNRISKQISSLLWKHQKKSVKEVLKYIPKPLLSLMSENTHTNKADFCKEVESNISDYRHYNSEKITVTILADFVGCNVNLSELRYQLKSILKKFEIKDRHEEVSFFLNEDAFELAVGLAVDEVTRSEYENHKVFTCDRVLPDDHYFRPGEVCEGTILLDPQEGPYCVGCSKTFPEREKEMEKLILLKIKEGL